MYTERLIDAGNVLKFYLKYTKELVEKIRLKWKKHGKQVNERTNNYDNKRTNMIYVTLVCRTTHFVYGALCIIIIYTIEVSCV